ncbi:DnaB-like helicase C-terminal domain-containing protein [Polynucleobacter sp. UK-Gri1-W3]|uniref:DnaB-like helicase C-terminal domain-containing protein n=1 Tax=Polynucleobacter sp. UK-Gri1-W3 TaxID=1819737 RepID=UPI001C0B93AB|nr:DnaB-like helicase C-terminal domain-containing protein [Polynucleobacter sp. UK-Gri1-W3]MBU3539046.1 AAA family ATPase [Polynucleobacter sp. UK-Gri1-W3]
MASILRTDNIDFQKYYAETEPSRAVFEKSDYEEDVAEFIANPGIRKGKHTPWDLAGEYIGLREGETSCWAGVNGHGKSLLVGQVMLTLAEQGEKILICSFEMAPKRTLLRMMMQAIGGDTLTTVNQKKFWDWKRDQVYVLDHHGMIDPSTIIAICRYAIKEKGVKHIVIDNLMRCIPKETDYDQQKDFVTKICALSHDTGVHMHLVHHLRKGEKESSEPDKSDIKGTGSIADQVDNIFMVWRNKDKENETANNRLPDNSIPDAALLCRKQRNGEWEGKIALWFDPKSSQFLDSSFADPHKYLGDLEM